MSKLPARFVEDKALRDAARAVLNADLAHAKASLSGKGLANRLTTRVAEGAKDVAEVAKVHADDNRGVLAVLIGALILWLARTPILEVFGIEQSDSDAEETLEPNSGQADNVDAATEETRLGEYNE